MLTFGTPAFSWTPASHEQFLIRAVHLAPPALKRLILMHKKSLLRGVGGHHVEEGSEDGTTMARQVRSLMSQTIEMIQSQEPFDQVILRLGRIGYLLAEMNNPLVFSDTDPDEQRYADDFMRYMERKLSSFPLIFDGYSDGGLSSGHVKAFLAERLQSTNQRYSLLQGAYHDGTRIRSSSEFDERSIPFAIASTGFSHSVSDIARIWLYIWKEANGDLTGTPFYRNPPSQPTPKGSGLPIDR